MTPNDLKKKIKKILINKKNSESSIVPEQSQMLGPFIILALSLVVLISAIFLKFRLN